MDKAKFANATAIASMLSTFPISLTAGEDPAMGRLEEVIVSARKIDENMQSVPVAVNTMSGDDVRALGVSSTRDILAFTPGATTTVAVADVSGISLRGISSGFRGASEDSGVMVAEDGEVVSRGFMHNNDLYDLRSVEVLRGPQGTTYGRNATAGVVSYFTERPTDEFQSRIILDAGSHNTYGIEGFISGALNDDLSARVSGKYAERGGYFENPISGDDIDAQDSSSLRTQISYNPLDDFSVLLKLHWTDFHSDHFSPRKNNISSRPQGLADFTGWGFVEYYEVSSDPWKVFTSQKGMGYDREVWGGAH